ncbi:hypothetical protein V8C42DRAFT_329069 [Trichoderma barbatum]
MIKVNAFFFWCACVLRLVRVSGRYYGEAVMLLISYAWSTCEDLFVSRTCLLSLPLGMSMMKETPLPIKRCELGFLPVTLRLVDWRCGISGPEGGGVLGSAVAAQRSGDVTMALPTYEAVSG